MASSRFEIAKNSPLSVTPVNKKQRNNSKESMNVSDNNQYNTYEILNEKFQDYDKKKANQRKNSNIYQSSSNSNVNIGSVQKDLESILKTKKINISEEDLRNTSEGCTEIENIIKFDQNDVENQSLRQSKGSSPSEANQMDEDNQSQLM